MNNSVPFTQYLLPDGRRQIIFIDIAPDLATKAHQLIALGLAFEIEVLRTGEVSATITDPLQGDLDISVFPNDPGVQQRIEELIRRFDPAAGKAANDG